MRPGIIADLYKIVNSRKHFAITPGHVKSKVNLFPGFKIKSGKCVPLPYRRLQHQKQVKTGIQPQRRYYLFFTYTILLFVSFRLEKLPRIGVFMHRSKFSLRRQLDQIYSREVTLPSGGRLVFDQTEALMAVDINSGKISGKVNFESMAHRTNMEAAEAIARQLKLRDIGGQVVIDFIEMRDKKHVLEVEKTLRTAMKNDRARHDVGRMSSFGLLELVRQRTGSSALSITMEPCPFCGGTGQRRNLEWQALQALREMRRALRTHGGDKYVFETTRELGLYLLNHKRDSLRDMEQDFGKCLEISIRP